MKSIRPVSYTHLGYGVEEIAVEPEFIGSVLHFLRIILFCEFLCHNIIHILKDQKKTRGRTRMVRMLKENKPLKFFTVPSDRLREFCSEGRKRGLLYVIIRDKKNPEMSEVMVFADDAAKVNRVMDKICLLYTSVQSGLASGAGDQGIMIGYACDETPQLMPMPVVLANRIVRELSASRRSGYITGILPDGKAQVTVEYEDDRPARLDTVIVSCQHEKEKSLRKLEHEIREKVLRPALRMLPPDEDTKILINPSGRFVCGGLDADTGLTGRKLMVDTYGSLVPHGGGAFSGKDCSKVDRSGAYMARYIAKNMVAAGLASRCQVSLAYAIGVAQPVMVQVDTFGTGKICADDCLAAAIPLVFGLTPSQICDTLHLKRPIYRQSAVFGHFGRKEFPWEKTDKAEQLRDTVM